MNITIEPHYAHVHRHLFLTGYDTAKQYVAEAFTKAERTNYDGASFRSYIRHLRYDEIEKLRSSLSQLAATINHQWEQSSIEQRHWTGLLAVALGAIGIALSMRSLADHAFSNVVTWTVRCFSALSIAYGVYLIASARLGIAHEMANQRTHSMALQATIRRDIEHVLDEELTRSLRNHLPNGDISHHVEHSSEFTLH